MLKKVVFICQANVGRSQMAEGFYNYLTASQTATSGAVKDYREKYNYKPTEAIVNIMKEVGIDISDQQIKLVTPKLVEDADLIVVLCEKELCPQFITDNPRTIYTHIEDPFQQDITTMRRIRDEIHAVVKDIVVHNNGLNVNSR